MSWRLREPACFRHGALRVLYDAVPGPLTAIALAVRAGSRFDGAHPGIAHMTEHMLFQGTRQLDQAALNRRAGDARVRSTRPSASTASSARTWATTLPARAPR